MAPWLFPLSCSSFSPQLYSRPRTNGPKERGRDMERRGETANQRRSRANNLRTRSRVGKGKEESVLKHRGPGGDRLRPGEPGPTVTPLGQQERRLPWRPGPLPLHRVLLAVLHEQSPRRPRLSPEVEHTPSGQEQWVRTAPRYFPLPGSCRHRLWQTLRDPVTVLRRYLSPVRHCGGGGGGFIRRSSSPSQSLQGP